jgi:hypothetical protein
MLIKKSDVNDNYSDHRLFGSTEDLDITTGASNDAYLDLPKI